MLNVMMDSKPILPNSYHPQSIRMSRDFKYWVSPRSRTAHPVKYYITDFGLSTTDLESADMDCGSAPYMSYGACCSVSAVCLSNKRRRMQE